MATVNHRGFNLDHVDDATAALILQLQDDDTTNLRNSENGKGRVDDVRDHDVALAMYNQELRHMHQALLERSTRLEHQVADRIIAPLSDATVERDTPARGRLPTASSSSGSESDLDTEFYTKEPKEEYSIDDDPAAIRLSDGGSTGYVNDREEEDHAVAESSHFAATRTPTPRPRIRSCVACLDRRGYNDNMAMAACGHWYCLACLTGLFESALKDDSLFPPRCCRRDPLQPSRMSLGKDLYERFQKKLVEYNTEDKTYCAQPSCSAFIPPTHPPRKQATCPVCKTDTCTICKKASHPIGWWKKVQGSWLNPVALHCTSEGASDGCSGDRTTQQVLDLAQEKKWQRCFKCRHMVEMEQGCNHIRCICGTEFCYVCGERWKRCDCPQWNEDSLLAPAEQLDALYPRNALPEADEPEVDLDRRLEWIQNELRTMNAGFARANRLIPAEQRDAGHPRDIVPEAHEAGVDPVRAALEYIRNELRTMNAAFTRTDRRLDPAGQGDARQPQHVLPEADQPMLDRRQTLENLRNEIQVQRAAITRAEMARNRRHALRR